MPAIELSTDNKSLEALFGIEIDDSAAPHGTVSATWAQIKCRKCSGSGNFIGWSGKIVGKCFACKGNGVHIRDDSQDASIDVAKIQTALNTAFKWGLKRPKLQLDAFHFSRAPDTGKNPGAIYVKEGQQYLGKVIDGKFHASRECGDEQKAKIVSIASNPEAAAVAHGKLTGACSCCGRELTNKESIERGIGPICAEKYGW